MLKHNKAKMPPMTHYINTKQVITTNLQNRNKDSIFNGKLGKTFTKTKQGKLKCLRHPRGLTD